MPRQVTTFVMDCLTDIIDGIRKYSLSLAPIAAGIRRRLEDAYQKMQNSCFRHLLLKGETFGGPRGPK